jgi:hypothetical protein
MAITRIREKLQVLEKEIAACEKASLATDF